MSGTPISKNTTRAPVAQRKKKTFPVITKCESVEPDVAPAVSVQGDSSESIAETLLQIIQTKPIIQAPIRKRKTATVADVIAGISGMTLCEGEAVDSSVMEVTKVPKKKTVKPKKNTVVDPIVENTESQELNQKETEKETNNTIVEPVVAELPKVPKKRTIKPKKNTVIDPIIENTESQNQKETNNTIIEPTIVEPTIAESTSDVDDIAQIMNQLSLGNTSPNQWMDQQTRNIQFRREPILQTFCENYPELTEELYHIQEVTDSVAITIRDQLSYPSDTLISSPTNTPHEYFTNTFDSIISNTLENTHDSQEEIMVESIEFNDQQYWVDVQNRILHKDTFQHIGQFQPETHTILFYSA